MAINRKSLRDDISAKDFNYRAGFYSLKKNLLNTNDCFNFYSYEALKNINDVKTNNYSNIFLSNKCQADKWLEYEAKKDDKKSLVSTISFFNKEAKNESKPSIFLYFNKNYEFWDTYLTSVECILTKNRSEEAYFNHIFQLTFLDDYRCKISHNFGDITFYLTVAEDNSISFFKLDDAEEEKSIFVYNLDGDNLVLYKRVKSPVYVYAPVLDSHGNPVLDEDGNPYEEIDEEASYEKNALYSLRCKQESNGRYSLVLSEDLEINDDSIILLNLEEHNFNLNVNASWVGYERGGAVDEINNSKSSFDLENQYIFHHQYNANGEINFIPLKNNFTYKNETTRGNNLSVSQPSSPDVNYRTYSSISSGIVQEKGSDNMVLNFTFNDQTFTIKDGEDLAFYINSKEENDGLEPLWPYRILNINDTKFAKNGAFASDVPYFADKIRCTQGAPLVYQNNNSNFGSYLCTWLYKNNENADVIWLDRYYYPDFITRTDALFGKEQYVESFDSVFDKLYHLNDDGEFNDYNKDQLAMIKGDMRKTIYQNAYFDKVSDFVIQPARNYIYSRLSSDMVNNVLKSIESNRITQGLDKNNVLVDLTSKIKLDGKNYLKIPYENFSNTNEINFNFDIYLDAKKRMGLQLIGTDYKSGFNIQNRKDLAPFHYVADENSVYMLNNSFEIKRSINLYGLYGDNIIKFVLGDIFDDIIVFTSTFLYILTYDLSIRAKIDYRVIMGINDVLIANDDGEGNENILNYPYINHEIIVERNVVESGEVVYNHGRGDLVFNKERDISPYSLNALQIFFDSEYQTDEGEIEIENRVVKIFTTYNSLVYKGNLYIPYYNKILKIIFVPDVEADNFTLEDRSNYPCKIRQLEIDEYYLNYMPSDYENISNLEWKESISDVVNEFIEIENIIKSIYISENGKIYGFNYDKIAISGDRDTVYGMYAKESYLNSGGWWWLFNQSLSKLESNQSTSKYAEFASMNSIDMVRFNEGNYMAMIRNFATRDIANASDDNKRLDIYDKTKERIYTYDLESYEKCWCLDSYNIIDEFGTEHSIFMCIVSNEESTYKISYHVNEERVDIEDIGESLPINIIEKFTETTNSNSIMRYADKNALYFNLYLPSSFIYDYVATIKWNLQDIQTGWYNINVAISLDDALFEVKINDKTLEKISFENDEYSWFLPYVNSNAAIFSSSIYIAKTPKRYGHTMGAILNYETDPYICKNTKIENASIFTKKLSYNEYQALRLENKKINPLTITIPCGQRNAIDEIARFFKYNATSNISNNIKINISGLRNIIDDDHLVSFKQELLSVLNERKEATVKIKEIEFVD